MGFPGGSDVKNPSASEGDPGSIPGSGRSPGEGNGNPLQHSCLEIPPVDRGAWRATDHRAAKSWTRLSSLTHTHIVPVDGQRMNWQEKAQTKESKWSSHYSLQAGAGLGGERRGGRDNMSFSDFVVRGGEKPAGKRLCSWLSSVRPNRLFR